MFGIPQWRQTTPTDDEMFDVLHDVKVLKRMNRADWWIDIWLVWDDVKLDVESLMSLNFYGRPERCYTKEVVHNASDMIFRVVDTVVVKITKLAVARLQFQ